MASHILGSGLALLSVLLSPAFVFSQGNSGGANPPFVNSSSSLNVQISVGPPPPPPAVPPTPGSLIRVEPVFLVIVTDAATGAGVTSLNSANFNVVNHLAIIQCGGVSEIRQYVTQLSELGNGAYRLVITSPVGCNEFAPGAPGAFQFSPSVTLQVLVSAAGKRGQGIASGPAPQTLIIP